MDSDLSVYFQCFCFDKFMDRVVGRHIYVVAKEPDDWRASTHAYFMLGTADEQCQDRPG